MPNQTFPIVNGQFQLPANAPRRLSSITVTCNSASGGSVTLTGPAGNVVYTTTFDSKGSVTLSVTNLPDLDPGTYTVVTTGTIVGSVNIGDR